jgi:hypothetical protein
VGKDVPHEVHPATLPAGAQHLGYGSLDPLLGKPIDRSASIPDPLAWRLAAPKYGVNYQKMIISFNDLSPPYHFRAVRSFGEYLAERDQNRPGRHSGSQELFAKKPANTGDFERSEFEERALPKG